MEEDNGSMISNAATAGVEEGTDSNGACNGYPLTPPIKSGNHETTSPARFKGVVPQPNGHWGAQIYADHRRIWLGTFKSEKLAAMAYDRATIKLRGGDPHRNFPWTELTTYEPMFQAVYTAEAVLAMIREGSYESKFIEFLRTMGSPKAMVDARAAAAAGLESTDLVDADGFTCRELFRKELTPSDVGKLNRLVIPKKHAMKCFPRIAAAEEDEEINGAAGGEGTCGLMLVFKDRQLDRLWELRYCYWKSSQSFVFTKGWNGFVKDKKLQAKDDVIFYQCEDREGLKGSFLMIDVRPNVDGGGGGVFEGGFHGNGGIGGDRRGIVAYGRGNIDQSGASVVTAARMEKEEGVLTTKPSAAGESGKGVWLFGVRID